MEDIINNLKKSDTCKFELMISIKFMASKNTDEERLMHSKSDNIEIENNADEVIEQNFIFTSFYVSNRNNNER